MDRPILFSSVMVKAILDGKKTQTRRVMKPQPQMVSIASYDGIFHNVKYLPGDRLWVRETWTPVGWAAGLKVNEMNSAYYDMIVYKADCDKPGFYDWRPSIFMPRWASRITLEVVNVRVERVQEITDADCYSEGIQDTGKGVGCLDSKYGIAKTLYAELWNSINAKRGYSWDANPWVWVVEFKRL